ncbi:MAG: iron ABC transporter permease [Rhodospirillales bacterium]|nr:iron ABC transporter permease [Rhodospirillales bacterium]
MPNGVAHPPFTRPGRRLDSLFPLDGWGWRGAGVGIAGLVALPVLVVLASLFLPTGPIWSHLAQTVLGTYVANSLFLMLGVGIGTFLMGVGAAWLVTLCRFPGARSFEWALLLPMAMPAYVIAYAYTGLFDFAGPVQEALRALFGWKSRRDYWFPELRSLPGAAAMLSFVLYPYVYMLARAAFLEQSVCALEVSRTLGCTPWRSFRTVALPLARPAIVAGLALALMEALNDFGTVQYFAVDTFTTGIYRTWLGLGQSGAAAQLGAILLLFVLALLLVERVSRGQARFHHATGRYRNLPRYPLRGGKALLAFVACLFPVAVGFLVPGAMLLAWAVETVPGTLDRRFLGLAGNTFILALLAAILAVSVAVLLAYAKRLDRTMITRAAARLASLGYAVPGSVIAVGVLVPFAFLDNALDAFLRRTFGLSSGLILTGTVAAVLFAYLVRFLAVAFQAVETSLGRITPAMEASARTLGATPLRALRRIHLPMMKGSLLTAALLVFVDVTKELPATLMMRPFNFDTLAIRAFELASDERLPDAALPSLAIVLVSIVPTILLSRAIARARPGDEG